MAKGANSKNLSDCSEIRTGMKREFAMMINQFQFITPIGRTRSSRSTTSGAGGDIENSISEKNKRCNTGEFSEKFEFDAKKSVVSEGEEELKSGNVELMSDDDKKSKLKEGSSVLKRELGKYKAKNGVQVEGYSNFDAAMSSKEGENKMYEKAVVNKCPTKLKELLQTGLCEGLEVRYVRRSKGPSDGGLRGIIRGDGILCFCDACHGATIVSPTHFELHAGSANKRPPEYIYLQNGRTFRDVLNTCKDVRPEALTLTIREAIGFSCVEKSVVCQNCKVVLPNSGDCRTLLCIMCMALRESPPKLPQESDTGDRSLLSVSSVRSSDGKRDDNLSSCKGTGKLTTKDIWKHKKGFKELVEGAEVGYFDGGKEMLRGYKRGSKIFCFCCNTEVSPSQFEAHAGYPLRRKPYQHIYMSNGLPLDIWAATNAQIRGICTAESDDRCSICKDGGDLLHCGTCPRAFHPVCISLRGIPEDKFYCRYCKNSIEKGKCMEHNANAIAAGWVAGVDLIEQINRQCIRISGTPADDIGGCVLCRSRNFTKTGFDDGTIIICDQCEREFHVGCLKEHKIDDLKELPTGKWFCCTECSSIQYALENLVAVGEEKLSDSLMNVIKRKHREKGPQDCGDLDIKWRLLCCKMASDETWLLLSRAVSIFHEQFNPITDSDGGHLDFITDMVYGRKTEDQDFGGMYCAILTVNSCLVSAALFRIFGREVAELPLVATASNYQGLGYFQSLFSCIETLLESLDVKNLVLPAADEAKSIWTKKFGFGKITQDQLNTYRNDYQMMVFQGTSVLHKAVCQA